MISVVVQGPVHGRNVDNSGSHSTFSVIESLRKWMPNSEIILSTWAGADCTKLTPDVLVTSEDPGAVTLNDTTLAAQTNNLNRMIVSTVKGLERCTRPFVLKMRTDCLVVGVPPFDAIFEDQRISRWKLFESKVIVLNTFTRHPLKRPVLFHLSDLVHFGRINDVKRLWCIDLVKEPNFTRSIECIRRPRFNAYPEFDYLFRCAPEQYLAESLSKQFIPGVNLAHHSDGRTSWLIAWLHILAANFVIMTPSAANVQLPKRMTDCVENFDLFQQKDAAWLNQWGASRTSWRVKCETILCYWEARFAYSPYRKLKAIASRLRLMFQICFGCAM